MRDAGRGESKGWWGAILGIAFVATLLAGGYYYKKHATVKDRETQLAKEREERKRNADPAKVLRDSQRMEDISRRRAAEQREQSQTGAK